MLRRSAHFFASVSYLLVLVAVPIAIEMEKVKQVPDRGTILRYIGIVVDSLYKEL